MKRPIKFAHVVLKTTRYEEMLSWWNKVLSSKVRYGNDFISFLSYDDEHHRVAFVQLPELQKPSDKAWGLAHVAYTLGNLGQLLGTYRRLKADGILPVRTINHGPTVSMYYKDPDGNQVELQVDAFDKAGAASYFNTEPFAQNPIGVLFDAEKMCADYEAGVPESELLRRPD